jgi:outer membrane protein assembly factor BamB
MMRRLAAVVVLTALAATGIALAREAAEGPLDDRGLHAGSAKLVAIGAATGDLPKTNLAPGSDPSVLPGPVLIADRDNNRLIEVSPTGRLLWQFPRPGDLVAGQTFKVPDDAFFAPGGRQVIVTQEDDFVVSVIDLDAHRIVYRYGHPGVPGSSGNYLYNPDDALLTPSGLIVLADIKNCRLLAIRPPSHRVVRQLGETGLCAHEPPVGYGSPNGWFPMRDGNSVVTEINGDWIDILNPSGHLLTSTNAPGFTYPSDTNEVRPGVLLSADYTNPGAIETFTYDGRLLWRYAPSGAQALNQPSLALPLPNGDILANDDYNHRVIVIDPHTNRIVWQYGHTRVAGSGPGYVDKPDGVDLAPPFSLIGGTNQSAARDGLTAR